MIEETLCFPTFKMPYPYQLIKPPPGDWKNVYEFQAINMGAAHNALLQLINAIVKHAPNITEDKVQPFLVFALTAISTLHHHHHLEETLTFPWYEEKLGKGAMHVNVEQHEQFLPGVEKLEQYLKDVQEGKEKYDGKYIVDTIESFGDVMVQHMTEELTTLDADRMRANFTEKELRQFESDFMKAALTELDFYKDLPICLLCKDPNNTWFPPFPFVIKWAIRLWFSRRHKEAWEFGPFDLLNYFVEFLLLRARGARQTSAERRNAFWFPTIESRPIVKMPYPYPLIKLPPGDWQNAYESQAINMGAAHNTFIQSINAIVKHAPNITENKIQPFLIFALTAISALHHHHHVEETFAFPRYEEKLGKGAMQVNVEQHEQFLPKVEELEQYLKEVQEGKAKYDGKRIIDIVESFGDVMIQHLTEELATLDADRMRANFTEKELKQLEKDFLNLILAEFDFYKNLPMGLVCMDPNNAWFPPLPLPIKWATRLWFFRRYKEAWEFGPLDLYGNPRDN
ncbi:hypothetical protein AX14_004095 [Amanita brunnescens Koide BX004]|nr:hypothetical protein AX14_004095 [Amanita brunnescens Koide BX004]